MRKAKEKRWAWERTISCIPGSTPVPYDACCRVPIFCPQGNRRLPETRTNQSNGRYLGSTTDQGSNICGAALELHPSPASSWYAVFPWANALPVLDLNLSGVNEGRISVRILQQGHAKILSATHHRLELQVAITGYLKYATCGFPGGPVIKNLPANAGDTSLIPNWGTNYSCQVAESELQREPPDLHPGGAFPIWPRQGGIVFIKEEIQHLI